MADKNILEQMLGHLVNDEQQKAEELFHEYVVAKSREIYENLIEAEMQDDEEEVDEAAEDEEAEEEKVDEAAEDDEEEMDENFEDVAFEGGDGEDSDNPFGSEGDATDDLAGEMGPEEEPAERGEEELFQDLDAIVDELQAKFDELKGIEGEEHGEMGGDEEEMKDDFELATVREYVEKVGGATYDKYGKMGDNGANTKSIVAGKNDMGGTTANIAKGGESNSGGTEGGLLKPSTQEENFGNVNVPGGNAGKTGFKKKEPGHGAEKKGAAEQADNKQSLFRGRR
jgi:hypothetical protein